MSIVIITSYQKWVVGVVLSVLLLAASLSCGKDGGGGSVRHHKSIGVGPIQINQNVYFQAQVSVIVKLFPTRKDGDYNDDAFEWYDDDGDDDDRAFASSLENSTIIQLLETSRNFILTIDELESGNNNNNKEKITEAFTHRETKVQIEQPLTFLWTRPSRNVSTVDRRSSMSGSGGNSDKGPHLLRGETSVTLLLPLLSTGDIGGHVGSHSTSSKSNSFLTTARTVVVSLWEDAIVDDDEGGGGDGAESPLSFSPKLMTRRLANLPRTAMRDSYSSLRDQKTPGVPPRPENPIVKVALQGTTTLTLPTSKYGGNVVLSVERTEEKKDAWIFWQTMGLGVFVSLVWYLQKVQSSTGGHRITMQCMEDTDELAYQKGEVDDISVTGGATNTATPPTATSAVIVHGKSENAEEDSIGRVERDDLSYENDSCVSSDCESEFKITQPPALVRRRPSPGIPRDLSFLSPSEGTLTSVSKRVLWENTISEEGEEREEGEGENVLEEFGGCRDGSDEQEYFLLVNAMTDSSSVEMAANIEGTTPCSSDEKNALYDGIQERQTGVNFLQDAPNNLPGVRKSRTQEGNDGDDDDDNDYDDDDAFIANTEKVFESREMSRLEMSIPNDEKRMHLKDDHAGKGSNASMGETSHADVGPNVDSYQEEQKPAISSGGMSAVPAEVSKKVMISNVEQDNFPIVDDADLPEYPETVKKQDAESSKIIAVQSFTTTAETSSTSSRLATARLDLEGEDLTSNGETQKGTNDDSNWLRRLRNRGENPPKDDLNAITASQLPRSRRNLCQLKDVSPGFSYVSTLAPHSDASQDRPDIGLSKNRTATGTAAIGLELPAEIFPSVPVARSACQREPPKRRAGGSGGNEKMTWRSHNDEPLVEPKAKEPKIISLLSSPDSDAGNKEKLMVTKKSSRKRANMDVDRTRDRRSTTDALISHSNKGRKRPRRSSDIDLLPPEVIPSFSLSYAAQTLDAPVWNFSSSGQAISKK